MSLRFWLAANPRAVRLGRIVGVGVFAVAFLLPACKFVGERSELINLGTYSGWRCAEFSLMLVTIPETFRSTLLLAVLGGLVNPMLLLYLAFFQPRFGRMRHILTWAILACLVATWIFFAINRFLPLIGHILWVAGILMILAGHALPCDNSKN
jgi:hypothetical protein